MVKVKAYLVLSGDCSIAHDSNTADDKIISSVIGSAIVNDESRFVGRVGNTVIYATEYDVTEDSCWVIAVGEELEQSQVTDICFNQQHVLWRGAEKRFEDLMRDLGVI